MHQARRLLGRDPERKLHVDAASQQGSPGVSVIPETYTYASAIKWHYAYRLGHHLRHPR